MRPRVGKETFCNFIASIFITCAAVAAEPWSALISPENSLEFQFLKNDVAVFRLGLLRPSVVIVDVVEITKPIASPIRNAYIDFTKMTTSLVAVVTDVIRDGKPVIGYGFNSNGRYGQGGLIRDRFRPRVLEADPASGYVVMRRLSSLMNAPLTMRSISGSTTRQSTCRRL